LGTREGDRKESICEEISRRKREKEKTGVGGQGFCFFRGVFFPKKTKKKREGEGKKNLEEGGQGEERSDGFFYLSRWGTLKGAKPPEI